MIASPVNTQGPALAIRRFNFVGGILREVDHLDGQMIRQRIVFCRGPRQFQQRLQLLFMGQMIEVRHAICPLIVPSLD